MRRRNKMTNPYCEKHEWPAGMGKPCPDCAELDNARRALNIHADAVTECKMVIDRLTLEGVKLRTENKQLQIDMGTVKQAREMADRAMASARTWQETANEKIKEVEPLQAENAKLRAELELAKKFHTDEYKNRLELTAKAESLELQNEALRKALLEIKAKLERSHDGGCILPLRDMVNDALGEGVAEKPKCSRCEAIQKHLTDGVCDECTDKQKSDLAICGWCGGVGKMGEQDCPKCHGAGGFDQKQKPVVAPQCPHDQGWTADGDRDICKRCGARSNPVI